MLGTRHDPGQIEYQLRNELSEWFGPEVMKWELLAVYRLPEALPAQHPHVPYPADRETQLGDRLWLCGELGSAPSIQWALYSGARAGASVAAALGQ